MMGVIITAIEPTLVGWVGGQALVQEITLVGTSAGLSIVVFLIMAVLLRIEELRWLWQLLGARLR